MFPPSAESTTPPPGNRCPHIGGRHHLPAPYAARVTEPVHPDRSALPRSIRITPIIAFVGVLLVLVGLLTLTRPVRTPLQDCGAAGAFILDGRVNEFADPNAPPDGLTADQVRANNRHPCQERAANRSRPAAAAIIAGTGAIGAAALAEVGIRWRLRVRRRDSAPEIAS